MDRDYNISVDRAYNIISNALSTVIASTHADSQGNLLSKNILMKGFYREFLNILLGWKLIDANTGRNNAPGIDLIDRENRIIAQVSAACNHEKIQNSLSRFVPPDMGNWHYFFVPIMMNSPKQRRAFDIPQNVTFDSSKDILNGTALLQKVQNATNDIRLRLAYFVQLEKVKLCEYLNGLLRQTRDSHPSFVLMEHDEIDSRLYPNIKEASALLDVYGKTSKDDTVCPIWDIIRDSWQKPENHSIVIEGECGVGKTVALFSIADAEDKYCPAPAVYVPMHSLVQFEDLSDYFRKQSDTYGHRINELAEKPWDDGPQLLVLLDGFNEVPAAKQRDMLNMLNEWHFRHPGAQFIAVSRPVDMVKLALELDRNFKSKPIAITLEPMTEGDARAYLTERDITPPEGADIWKVLVYPLFLTLYVKTNGLMGQTVDGYLLAPKSPRGSGTLIWNFIQRELLREGNGEWVLRCAIACEYLLPFIAFRMEREHRFTIERSEAKALIQEALHSIDLKRVPHHLAGLLNHYNEWHGDFPDLSVFNWIIIVLKDVGLLKANYDSYAFIHQHFRDALAGLYLVNQAEMMRDGDALPEVWRRAANYDIMGYAAELMEEPEAQRLWETNRVTRPTDKSATYAMLELQMRRSDVNAPNLNFSGMDLRGICLKRYTALCQEAALPDECFRGQGHSDRITCAAVTSDDFCISGSKDKTLRLWDLRIGESLNTLKGHNGSVNCVAITKDGLCVSGSEDNTLRVWDMHTGECLRVLEGHTHPVNCVAVTQNGRCVSGSSDRTMRLWDLNTGKCLLALMGHAGSVNCIAVTQDGRCVSGSSDNTLRIWDWRTGECLRILEGHIGMVTCVAVTEDGLCVSGSQDKTLRVWDLSTGVCLRTLKGHASSVNCVTVTQDGLCVSGSSDKTLRVWDLNTSECLRSIEGASGEITCVSITESGQCAGISPDGDLWIWDIATGMFIQQFMLTEGSEDDAEYLIEESLNRFFQSMPDKYPSFASLRQFIEKENNDVKQAFLNSMMGDLFRLADAQDAEHLPNGTQAFLELLWKLYLVDSDRIKSVRVPILPNVKSESIAIEETLEKSLPSIEEKSVLEKSQEEDGLQQKHKPKPGDLEEATRLVLLDFEMWWNDHEKKEGQTLSIEKHATKQLSGTQFGYDVGLTSTLSGCEYRLRFECKDYTSNIKPEESDKVTTLKVKSYAYNLLEYYMYCDHNVNNRWVLVCPFGDLQNDFPENLFKKWNQDHAFMKIYAITELGSSLTCKEFLSVNEEAYRLVYKSNPDVTKKKEDVFQDLYNRIIGTNDVREAALARLKNYSFWDEYRGHGRLLAIHGGEKQTALDGILCFTRRDDKNNGEIQKNVLYVIGEYGTGKSWLCFQAIEQIVLHPSKFPVMPFYLRLKELSISKELEDETKHKSIIVSALRSYYSFYDVWAAECVLNNFTPVFFLDGFDEVFSGLSVTEKKIEFLSSIMDTLTDWYEKHENEREISTHVEPLFVITSRESDFEVSMKSKKFQQQRTRAEIIELKKCSAEDVKAEWHKLEPRAGSDCSGLFQLEQNDTFIRIIQRPVFFSLCAAAAKRGAFKDKLNSASWDETDILEILFENELQDYAQNEGADQEELRNEIYRCALECTRENKTRVAYKGKSINQMLHVGMVKIEKVQDMENTCAVRFEHNIVREYLTAKYLSLCLAACLRSNKENPLNTVFIQTIIGLSLTPETLKLLLLCFGKLSSDDNGAQYKQLLKEWLCNKEVKTHDSNLAARLLEILLQPGCTLSGEGVERKLDLSGLRASDLCLWDCKIQHVNLSRAELRNWQMINLELDDVDLRGADMSGLRLSPTKPISAICHWEENNEWHVAILHENGQLMKYCFPNNSWGNYSAKVLSKSEVKEGLFHFENGLLFHSEKSLYDMKESELYQIRSRKLLRRVVTASGLCWIVTEHGNEYQAVIFMGDTTPTAFSFGRTKPGQFCLTETGQVICVQGDSVYMIDQNGNSRWICRWERGYECLALYLEPTGEFIIYIKYGMSLIRITLDDGLRESSRIKLTIIGDDEMMRELRILSGNELIAIGNSELYILTIEKNKGVEEIWSRKLKTAILIRNALLGEGINRMKDDSAYDLLSTSIC